MKIQIKKRFNDEILIEGEANSFKEFVESNKADLSRANLSRANLSRADLSKANLAEAELSRANLYGAKIRITQKDEIIKALRIEILD